MKLRQFSYLFIFTFCFYIQFLSVVEANGAEKTLVLVSESNLSLEKLSVIDIRKMYLGYPVKLGDNILRPIINHSDEILYDVFLQKIVFISSRSYKRRLKSQLFRTGRRQLLEARNQSSLIRLLKSEEHSVTFMWLDASKQLKLDYTRHIWSGVTKH